MTIDEIRNYKITEEDRLNMQKAKGIENFDDCPPLSKSELSKFKPHSKMNKSNTTRITSNDLGQLTEKDYKMIEEASKKPIAYDEDCSELTDSEIINEMIKIYNKKSENSNKIAN